MSPGEPLMVVPPRDRTTFAMRVLTGALVLFAGSTMGVAIAIALSLAPPPENATPGETLLAGGLIVLSTYVPWRETRKPLDLLVTEEGVSVPVRRLSLVWGEVARVEWDGASRTLFAVRTEDRAWYRRERIPLISSYLYDFSTTELLRLRSLCAERCSSG